MSGRREKKKKNLARLSRETTERKTAKQTLALENRLSSINQTSARENRLQLEKIDFSSRKQTLAQENRLKLEKIDFSLKKKLYPKNY